MLRMLTIVFSLALLPISARATLYEFTITSLTVHPDHPAPTDIDGTSYQPGDVFLILDLPDHRSIHLGSGCPDAEGVYREYPVPGSCETIDAISHWLEYDLTPDGDGGLTGWLHAGAWWHEGIDIASVEPGLWRGTFASELWFSCYLPDDYPCAVEGTWTRVSSPAAVPEPGPLALLLVGLGGLLMVRRAATG